MAFHKWKLTEDELPPAYVTVLTWHEDDLHPVCAARIPVTPSYRNARVPDYWARVIEGPEDADPMPEGANGPLYREPTWWRPLMAKPAKGD